VLLGVVNGVEELGRVILGVLIRVAWSGLDIRYHLSYTRLTHRVHTSLCSAKLTFSLAMSLCLL